MKHICYKADAYSDFCIFFPCMYVCMYVYISICVCILLVYVCVSIYLYITSYCASLLALWKWCNMVYGLQSFALFIQY